MPRLTNMDVEFVSLVDRAAVRDPHNPSEPQRFLLYKRESGGDQPGGTEMPNDTAAKLAKAEQERDAAIAKRDEAIAKAQELETRIGELEKASKPEPKAEAIDKSDLPAPVREALEKAEADRASALAKAEEAEKIAKSERDQRVTREFVAKAETFSHLPQTPAQFGPVLKAVAEKLSKDEADELDRVLKAAENQIAEGRFFAELGKSGDPQASDSDDAIARKAEEIRKADPTLTRYESMREAMRDPSIQRDYLSARR